MQNVTDIDDDILKRAKQENKDWKELGYFWTDRFLEDIKRLNIKMPDHYVRATDSIETIIFLTQELLKKGYAYKKDGNVYFDYTAFNKYGNLSGLNMDQMFVLSKERGGNPDDPLKKHPLDFVLWQKSAVGEPFWISGWGNGRPGWHIECSAMIKKYLGDRIDIHGGGEDLIFPHHESEIAQSESATGEKPFVGYWMHVAMLKYKREKMSKSLQNLVLVDDLLKKYEGDAIRWMLLSHHYRKPWEFFYEELDKAEKTVLSLKKKTDKSAAGDIKQVESLLEDDMNTPFAINIIQHSFSGATLQKTLALLGFMI